ncbi:GspE/PulE family protein [Acidiphilium iwatense]|uniref:GspE/PulE family protein n=1 Tax=Acidiphilium iwatense TaxID=768198 RepID=A0ABS9DUE6_9PROT|nr:GspE/PulE family protein [Acidiphilium iwatense]MCF3945753.1 GspE/PulE family protein [Acidiphilium iwatense]
MSAIDLARVQRLAAESGDPIDVVATRLGFCSEVELLAAFAGTTGAPIAQASHFPVNPVLDGQINPGFLRQARVLPLFQDDTAVHVAMANPLDNGTIEALEFAVRRPVTVMVATATEIEGAWERLYNPRSAADNGLLNGNGDLTDDVERLRDLASEAPVIRFVNQLIAQAVEMRASDIHLEPFGNRLRVRFRLDGRLREMDDAPDGSRAAIVSRLKIMARLNIAERRLAQDGRFRIALRGLDVDLRIATTPTLHGEAVVLRILDSGQVKLDLASLGFPADRLVAWRQLLALPHGIVLVTGPTGSGKTTTLYAGLAEINTADRKILSIEDPIELQLEGVNQVQVKPAIGLDFAQALRSFLRHDPDVILVGEIRDLETAQTAVQAALTGHLILSTLHTNDAASAITRLVDMGIDDYLLASTVHGILAQRLVRKLCVHCRQPAAIATPPPGYDGKRFFQAVGCDACNGTGFSGRTVISELLGMSDDLRRLMMRRVSADELRKQAIDQGMTTLYADGLTIAAAGITTLDEVMRACMES